MSDFRLKLAIISDLHCHPSHIPGDPSTYLITDRLRFPVNDHPVESLIKVINAEKVNTDLTLCPGDFTDKANVQGLISGWSFSLEIHNQLKAKDILATVGNHDVDVYGSTSNYSLTNVKGLKQGFPIKDEGKRDTYWSKGCVFVEGVNYRVLVINSSHFHFNKESSHNGEISPEALEYIENYLSTSDKSVIQIAMSHHPPIPHPRKRLGEDDKIVNGDKLLKLLIENNFDLFVYGHKHDPFLKCYSPDGEKKITLFSSGSFSAGANIMFAGLRNAFHTMEIVKRDGISKGTVSTWTYLPDDGWKRNYDESAFHPFTGFGNEKSVKEILELIKGLLESEGKMEWSEIVNEIEDIKHLMPSDAENLYKLLKENQLTTDNPLGNNPTRIFNLKKL